MTEPTTATAAGWAVAAGALGAFFTAIGVSWAAVFWGLCGGLLGLSFAPTAGRLRSILMFPASALLAAKAGALVALHWGWSGDAGGGLAAGFAIILHPTIAAVVKALPAFVNRRMGGQQDQGAQP